jgi:hypothetical protein
MSLATLKFIPIGAQSSPLKDHADPSAPADGTGCLCGVRLIHVSAHHYKLFFFLNWNTYISFLIFRLSPDRISNKNIAKKFSLWGVAKKNLAAHVRRHIAHIVFLVFGKVLLCRWAG